MEETTQVSSEDDETDDNSSSSDGEACATSEKSTGAPLVYKNRTHFRDNEEYAKYVRNKIQVGMSVKCCRSYEEVHDGDIGKVIKVRPTKHLSNISL